MATTATDGSIFAHGRLRALVSDSNCQKLLASLALLDPIACNTACFILTRREQSSLVSLQQVALRLVPAWQHSLQSPPLRALPEEPRASHSAYEQLPVGLKSPEVVELLLIHKSPAAADCSRQTFEVIVLGKLIFTGRVMATGTATRLSIQLDSPGSNWGWVALFGGITFKLLKEDLLQALPRHKLVDVGQQQPHSIAFQATGAEVGVSKICGSVRDLFDLHRVLIGPVVHLEYVGPKGGGVELWLKMHCKSSGVG